VNLYIHSPIRIHGVVLNYLSTGIILFFITVLYVYFPSAWDQVKNKIVPVLNYSSTMA
jgi:hypothetical protein